MNRVTKILLTIPSIIGIAYMATFWSNDFFVWITNNVIDFEYQIPIINGIVLLQIGYLIYRLWNYKNIEKKTKTEWTYILIIFNVISSLIFIWKKDNELNKIN